MQYRRFQNISDVKNNRWCLSFLEWDGSFCGTVDRTKITFADGKREVERTVQTLEDLGKYNWVQERSQFYQLQYSFALAAGSALVLDDFVLNHRTLIQCETSWRYSIRVLRWAPQWLTVVWAILQWLTVGMCYQEVVAASVDIRRIIFSAIRKREWIGVTSVCWNTHMNWSICVWAGCGSHMWRRFCWLSEMLGASIRCRTVLLGGINLITNGTCSG